ncbi:hypothetical protein PR048_016356 [Dryococelus australis]|uniref:Uncharacterized protein n=1 Tax=Dryococelus australis TaxID=614101 RepID=A0ABQ9HJY5_9NEOP|nr:hypothetical protein PR048_016356 [Dryococelus australis]
MDCLIWLYLLMGQHLHPVRGKDFWTRIELPADIHINIIPPAMDKWNGQCKFWQLAHKIAENTRILFALRTTPMTKIQKCQAELLIGRKLKTIFDSLHPSTLSTSRVEMTDTEDKQGRHFTEGDCIFLCNYVSVVVITKEGLVMYTVQTPESRQIHQHHVDQLSSQWGNVFRCTYQSNWRRNIFFVENQQMQTTDGVPECPCFWGARAGKPLRSSRVFQRP